MQPVKRTRINPFVLIGVLMSAAGLGPSMAVAADNPIVIENLQPGTPNWEIPFGTAANDKLRQIKGYASAASVNKGENITFYVSVNPAQTYTIDVYRLGYYQGLGGRLMAHIGPLNGTQQATCPTDPTTGAIECQWTPAYTLSTQTSWTSGIYVAHLTNAQNFRNYIVFTVRDDGRVASLVYQQPVTTYQAYNNYPNDNSTGKSLYEFNSYGATTVTGGKAAAKVSFDRPYNDDGSGGDLLAFEIQFVHWIEKNGYDVTYITDLETHLNGAAWLTRYRGFLSVGHDEYWSRPMYDAVVGARDLGVNVGFFGADAVYWHIRFESSSTNVPNRVIVCYRYENLDPVTDPSMKTVLWRDPPLNRPEQTLIGVQYISQVQWAPVTQYGTYVVNNSQNWVYAGSGFHDGDRVTGIVGYEADRYYTEYPSPNAVPGTYTLLSTSPFTGGYGNSSVYQAGSGAWVFATGSMAWNWALDNYGEPNLLDTRIQKATANVLDRFVAGAAPTGFSLAASPASQLVQPGSTGTYNVTITASGGFNGAVTLGVSGLPPGATGTFAPNPATSSSVLSVTTAAGTPGGTYPLTITGTNGGTTATTTVAMNVPMTGSAPTVSLGTSPANGSTIMGTVTLTATATDDVGVAGVQFLLDGAPLGAEDTASPYSISWTTTTASNGAHALSARARDAAGNTALATPVNVTVDNQAPTGSVVINGGAAATDSRTVTLTLAATDNAGAVSQMRFSNSTTGFSAAEAYATSKTWTLSSGTGTKTVYVQFRDVVGNWSGSFTDTIVIDTTTPTISAVAASGVTSGSATITWTTSEPATSQVEYGPTKNYGTLTPIDSNLVTAHSVTLTGLNPLTTYNYRVRSADAAGNERVGSNATFKTTAVPPDPTPPSMPSSLAATAVSAGQIDLTWSASTDNVAVTGYRVFRNGTQIATVSALSYSSVGLSPNTTYTYTVAAYDAQNNVSPQSAPASATTPADTTAPTVSITSPAGGATVFGTITVTANASDNIGVAGVTFTVDGSTIGTEDTSSPYSVSLNTTTLSDGAHTLRAIARDTSNLSTTSAPVSIPVNNTAPPNMMIRYVNTASTVGGDGTTNATTGANRAFKSLLDAINSLPDVLTMPVVIYCDGAGGPDTTPVNQTPFDMVTSAANYLLITTNAANRARVPHDPARYTLMATNSNALYNNIPSHIRIDGIQVQLTISNGGSYIGIKTSNANEIATDIDARISNTVVKCVVSRGNAIGFNTRYPSAGARGNAYVWNSVAYGCTTGFNNDFPGAQYVNNTAFNNDFGFVSDAASSMKVVNCLAAKGTKSGSVGFVGTMAAGSDYNAEDDGNGAPGAHSRPGRTFTFVNASTSDVHLAATDTGARDVGTSNPLPGKFADDIDGVLRSGIWDIGADESGS
jgi:chitodextrinase